MAGFRSVRDVLGTDRPGLAAADDRLNKRLGVTGEPASPVHAVTMQVLSDLIGLGMGQASGGETPLIMRTLMRTLNEAKPMLLGNISKMPPAQIKAFMGDLVARMQTILDTPDTTEGTTDGQSAGEPVGHEPART